VVGESFFFPRLGMSFLESMRSSIDVFEVSVVSAVVDDCAHSSSSELLTPGSFSLRVGDCSEGSGA
jgi:hypothetical protein